MALIILFVGLILFLIFGIPVAFSIILSSTLLLGLQRGFLEIPSQYIAQRVIYGIDSFPLLAVPLFILVGQLMNSSGITNRIFAFANTLVGHMKVGLAHVNIIASLIFAGMSGAATADAAGLGAVEIKAMTDDGYDLDFSVGVTAASSLIGPILPPSIPVLLYAILANVSPTKLLMAGLLPGIVMAMALMLFARIIGGKRNYRTRPRATIKDFLFALKKAFFPLLTPIILVGGILSGVFTATEAAAIAAAYSLILFIVHTHFNWKELIVVIRKSTRLSAAIMFILTSAQLFSTLIIRSRVPVIITEKISLVTTSPYLILFLVVLTLLIAGCFMSAAVSINILTPVVVPIIIMAGFDPLYFGIIMITTLMIGELTPPFGMVLFAIMDICEISFDRLVKSALIFTIPVFAVLILLILWPGIVMFIPNLM